MVDGIEQPLNFNLQTGQRVEIITRKGSSPQRIWLQPNRGYIKTSRARDNIQSWFREHTSDLNMDAGRIWLEEEFDKLGLTFDEHEIAKQSNYDNIEDLYVDVALGNVLMRDIATNVLRNSHIFVGNQWISLFARDRPGLLRDVSDAVLDLDINVVTSTSRTEAVGPKAWIELELDIKAMEDIPVLVDKLTQVAGIKNVRRGRMGDLSGPFEV